MSQLIDYISITVEFFKKNRVSSVAIEPRPHSGPGFGERASATGACKYASNGRAAARAIGGEQFSVQILGGPLVASHTEIGVGNGGSGAWTCS